MTQKPSRQQVGRAGELFVAVELNRRSISATLYLINTPRVDVTATSSDGRRTVNIQVKTKRTHNPSWQWDIKKAEAERRAPETDYMILVDLYPEYYIRRLSDVAEQCLTRHRAWLKEHGGKRPQNDDSTRTAIRMDMVVSGKGAWGVLGVLPQ